MPSTTTSGARYLLVAVDASTIAPDARHSSTLALAAALAAPADEIHLLSVLSGGSASSSSPLALLPSPGLSTAGAAEALVEARIRASKEDRIAASSWLHSSRAALVGEFGVEQERVFLHLLNPAAPGSSSSSSSSPSSSSTAAAIVAYAHATHADVVVLGSRGMGALARAVGSVGFGGGLVSVSDAVVHGLHSGAVAVARPRGEQRALLMNSVPALVKVVVAVDGSPASRAALLFACRWASGGGALAGRATLFLVSAPRAPPFPVVFDDDAPSSAVAASYGAERWEEEKEAAAAAARVAVEESVATAVEHGVDRAAIETAALDEHGSGGGGGRGGAGGGGGAVAEALSEFAESVGARAIVVGSRGLGAWKRAALALVGMGSVSSALLHSSAVPIIVVKSAEEEEVYEE